jgi:hypothetical protein
MRLYDFKEFLTLSSVLNYNLSAASLNRYNVLLFIIGDKKLDQDDRRDREHKSVIMDALNYLFLAYRQKRRRLGPLAVLHPLRAAALFTRACDRLNLIALLSALFHDVLEDIKSIDYDVRQWKEMESQFYGLFERLSPEESGVLVQRLECLTRLDTETYYQYIARLLECAKPEPEIVQIKLADRLDNTLDMRIELEDPLSGIDFFQDIFQILFVNNYPGYHHRRAHQPTTALNGARRLYQLFKNAVLLSMIRQMVDIGEDRSSRFLFRALSDASLLEAQRTLIHLLEYHSSELTEQRTLLLETMAYCYSGKTDLVTEADNQSMLDGLFSTYFGHTSKKARNRQLDRLYDNKPLMIQASIAFIVIFLSFSNDKNYYVKGISASGVSPNQG